MNIWNRILCDIVLFLFAVMFPWWAAIILATYLFFIFDNFYEWIILGFTLDILFGVTVGRYQGDQPVLFIIAAVSYILLSVFKKKLRSHV